MMVLMGYHAQPTRTLGHKEPDGGPPEGGYCSGLPPNKSYLLWFEIVRITLGLVQKLRDLPVISSKSKSCQQRETGQGLHHD